jgi:hypothetical protein
MRHAGTASVEPNLGKMNQADMDLIRMEDSIASFHTHELLQEGELKQPEEKTDSQQQTLVTAANFNLLTLPPDNNFYFTFLDDNSTIIGQEEMKVLETSNLVRMNQQKENSLFIESGVLTDDYHSRRSLLSPNQELEKALQDNLVIRVSLKNSNNNPNGSDSSSEPKKLDEILLPEEVNQNSLSPRPPSNKSTSFVPNLKPKIYPKIRKPDIRAPRRVVFDDDFSSYVCDPNYTVYDAGLHHNPPGISEKETAIVNQQQEEERQSSSSREKKEERDILSIIKDPIPLKKHISLEDFRIEFPEPMPISAPTNKKNEEMVSSGNGQIYSFEDSFSSVLDASSLVNNPDEEMKKKRIVLNLLPQLPQFGGRPNSSSNTSRPTSRASAMRAISSSASDTNNNAADQEMKVISNSFSIDIEKFPNENLLKKEQYGQQLFNELKQQWELQALAKKILVDQPEDQPFTPEQKKYLLEQLEIQKKEPSYTFTMDNEHSEMLTFCDTISESHEGGGRSHTAADRKAAHSTGGIGFLLGSEIYSDEPIQYDEKPLFSYYRMVEETNSGVYHPKNFNNKLTPQYEIIELLGKGAFSGVWKSRNHLNSSNPINSMTSTTAGSTTANTNSNGKRRLSLVEAIAQQPDDQLVAIKVYNAYPESISSAKRELQFYTSLSEFLAKRNKSMEDETDGIFNDFDESAELLKTIAVFSSPKNNNQKSFSRNSTIINRNDFNLSVLYDFLIFKKFYCFIFPIYSSYNLLELMKLLKYQQQYLTTRLTQFLTQYHQNLNSNQPNTVKLSPDRLKFLEDKLQSLLKKNYIFHMKELKSIIRQVCNGLYYLHHHLQYIHMDLKPENILISIQNPYFPINNENDGEFIHYLLEEKDGYSYINDYRLVLTDFSHAMKIADTKTYYKDLEQQLMNSSTDNNESKDLPRPYLQSLYYRSPEIILRTEFGKKK